MGPSTSLRLLSLVSLAAFAVACGGSSSSGLAGVDAGPTDPSGTDTTIVGTEDPDAAVPNPQGSDSCTKIDFVFVVDNSGSMSEEQANLGTNFPRFVDAIEAFRARNGQALDYRIAVTTSGISHTITIPPQQVPGFPIPLPGQTIDERGEDGAFQQKGACNMSRRWLQKGDSNVAQSFACVAKVGTNGPSFEMPLEGAKRAVVERVADGTNAGFLRDDALLAVIFLTDEDDCSTPLASFTANDDTCVPPPPGLVTVPTYLTAFDNVKGGGTVGRSVRPARTSELLSLRARHAPQPCIRRSSARRSSQSSQRAGFRSTHSHVNQMFRAGRFRAGFVATEHRTQARSARPYSHA
jgi:hypothetical protein